MIYASITLLKLAITWALSLENRMPDLATDECLTVNTVHSDV